MERNDTPQGPFTYDVFISYRHKPLDNRICKKLHTLLETYKPSRRYQSAKIKRVFRDDEELPVAGILSDTIKDALHSARYLVVVCSPDTPESGWVDREVRTFIALGKSDKIFALVIGGSREASFPKSLLAAEGIESRTLDIRASREKQILKLLKREMLKIVAAVSAIPYDHMRVADNRRSIRRFILKAAALTVFLAASGLYSLFQWAQASYYNLYAQREQLLINDVVNGITFDLPARLEGIPEAWPVLAGILGDNLDYLERMAAMDPESIDTRKSAGGNYLSLAGAWVRLGDYEKTAEYVEKAVSIYEKLADEGANPSGKQDLVNSYSMAGLYMEYAGKTDAAISFFSDAIGAADPLYEEKPDTDLKKSIADNNRNIGDCYAMSGDMEKAEKYYSAAAAYYEDLVSGGGMTERDLAGIYDLTAKSLNSSGQYESALSYYHKEKDIFSVIAKADNTANKDLGLCVLNEGLVYLTENDAQKAIDAFKLSAALFEAYGETSKYDAGLYETQALSSLGSAYQQLGQYEAAGESFLRCQTILDGFDENPTVIKIRADNFQNIGLNNKYASRMQDAADAYGKAIALYKRLIDEDRDFSAAMDLGRALNDLGTVYLASADYKSAASAFNEAISQYEAYAKSGGANTDQNIAISSYNAGLASYNAADFENSNKYAFAAADIYTVMLGNKPGPAVKKALADCYNLIGSCYAYLLDSNNALEYHRKCADIYANLAGSETDLAYQKGYAIALYGVVTDRIITGNSVEAEKMLITSLQLCDKIVNGGGVDFASTCLSFYALYDMFFGENKEAEARDIAKQAYDSNPGDSFARQTYAYALVLAGNSEEADAHLSALVSGNPANLVFMKYDLELFRKNGVPCEALDKAIDKVDK